MEFSPAFYLLTRFTKSIPQPAQKERVSEQELISVAHYLGVALPRGSGLEQAKLLEDELDNQNRFLTLHLHDADIDKDETYRRSQFVREVVENNRSRQRRP